MKKCPSCGFECEDNVKFCTECGAAFPDEPDFFVSPAPAPVKAGKQELLKNLTGSKLAMILVLAFTLMLVGSVFATTLVPETLNEYAGEISSLITEYGDEYLDELPAGLGDTIQSALSKDFSVNIGSAIAQKFFPILTAIAFWVLFISAKSSESLCCNSTGFKIIRVLKLIGFIIRIVLFAAVALIMALIAKAIDENGYTEYMVIPFAVLICVSVIFIFTFFFYTGLLRTLKTLSCVAEGRECKVRVSGYVAFIYFLGGIVSIIGAVISGVNANGGTLMYILAGIGLLSGIYCLAVGKYIRRCKKLKTV